MEQQGKNQKIYDYVELDLSDILHTLRKWWWMIAVFIIAASIAAYFITIYTYTPTYTASASMIINSKQIKIIGQDSENGATQKVTVDNNIALSRELVNTYSVIMRSDRMMKLVAKDLGLSLPPSVMRGFVSVAQTQKDTEVLTVMVNNPDPELAAQMANSIMKVAPEIISNTVEVGSVKIVDYAQTPRYPIPPQTTRNTGIAAMLGFLLGAGLALLIRFLDKTIKNIDDVSNRLGFTPLGGIPYVSLKIKSGKMTTPMLNSDWVSYGFVEAYKSLRTNLHFSSAVNNARSLMIASSLDREGKTTLAVNLAMGFAQSGKRALLLDCDLRKPSIYKRLGLKIEPGKDISSVLTGDNDYEDCIINFEPAGIDVLPAKTIPPNPSELLESENMKNLLAALKQAYDLIIIDTPPAYLLTDAIALSKYCDGVIMVVRQGYAAQNIIVSTKKAFENVGARLLGCVLNAIKYKEAGAGYGHQYYNRYYNSYYNQTLTPGRKKRFSLNGLLTSPGSNWVFTGMTITGIILVIIALVFYLTPLYETAKIFVQPAGKPNTAITVAGTQGQATAKFKKYPAYGEQYATLLIPAINIHQPVFFGDSRDQLLKGVGHYSGSYFPGEGGTIIYAGHNNNIFKNLKDIQIGNDVLIETEFGNFRYQVYDIKIVKNKDLQYIKPNKNKEILVMYTCYPFNVLGYKEDRYIVFAQPVNNTAAAQASSTANTNATAPPPTTGNTRTNYQPAKKAASVQPNKVPVGNTSAPAAANTAPAENSAPEPNQIPADNTTISIPTNETSTESETPTKLTNETTAENGTTPSLLNIIQKEIKLPSNN